MLRCVYAAGPRKVRPFVAACFGPERPRFSCPDFWLARADYTPTCATVTAMIRVIDGENGGPRAQSDPGGTAMQNEDADDDGDVSCPICKSTGGCDHLLLFYDVTFSQVDGGVVVEPYDVDAIVAKAFAKTLREDKDPAWHDWRIARRRSLHPAVGRDRAAHVEGDQWGRTPHGPLTPAAPRTAARRPRPADPRSGRHPRGAGRP